MLKNLKKRQRGDTLIEVIFAITIFSSVAITSLSIMNQGSATSERALEITLVRSQIDSQTKVLQFLNASYSAAFQSGDTYASFTSPAEVNTPAGQWATMMTAVEGTSGDTLLELFGSGTTNEVCPDPPADSFIIDTHNVKFNNTAADFAPANDVQSYSQLVYTSNGSTDSLGSNSVQGIWIQAIRSATTGTTGYVDFHIDACWASPGQSAPVTLGTIVRLYEPR
jgi:type II secretory pathway pseudopilin PulG